MYRLSSVNSRSSTIMRKGNFSDEERNLKLHLYDYIWMYVVDKLGRLLRNRFLLFTFILTVCFIFLVKTGVNKYRSYLAINGTAFQLMGDLSIPIKPNYTFPYFVHLPPPSNGAFEPYHRKCTSCSVVSSSGHLLNSNAGAEIDSSDCVFRINNASTEAKYHSDVGQKLSLRILSSRGLDEYLEFLSSQPEESIQLEDILIWDANIRLPRLDRVTAKAINMAKLFSRVNVYLLQNHVRGSPSFDTFIDREVGLSSTLTGSSCSSGFYAMAVAAYICDTITVYGMSSPEHCFKSNNNVDQLPQAPYHYQPPFDKVGECDMFRSRWRDRFTVIGS